MSKLLFTVDEYGIAKITLNNPSKRNVLSSDVIDELEGILSKIERKQDTVTILIVNSNFPEFFSAGGDVKEWYAYEKEEAYEKGLHGRKVFQQLEDLPVLTIASISGSCLGGGNELALACDYRIATEDAKFGQPEVLLGNGLAWGGYYRLVKTIGLAKAKEFILLGQTYSAQESLNVGLVNHIVKDWEALQEKTYDIARNAAINAKTIKVSKHILNQIGNDLVPSNALIDGLSGAYFAKTTDSNRRKEAFFAKRLNEVMAEDFKRKITDGVKEDE